MNSYNTKIENKRKCISEINNAISKIKPAEAFVTKSFDLEYVTKKFAIKKISVLGEIARGVKDV